MNAVTLERNCYIYVCAGCDLLNESERSDTMTCSGQCRVRAHRNGSLKTLRDIAKASDIKPASILHAMAISRLRPDLEKLVMAGTMTIADTMPELRKEFWSLVMKAAAAVDEEVPA